MNLYEFRTFKTKQELSVLDFQPKFRGCLSLLKYFSKICAVLRVEELNLLRFSDTEFVVHLVLNANSSVSFNVGCFSLAVYYGVNIFSNGKQLFRLLASVDTSESVTSGV